MTDAESSTDFLSSKTLHLKIVAVLMICGLFAVTIGYSAHEYVDFDEAIYLIMGRNMAITGCPMNVAAPESVFVDSPPLIPYFASALQWAGVESIFWIRTFHVTLWVLPCLIGIYLLGLRLFHHPAVGLLALLLFSTRWFVFQEAARVKLDVPLASLSTLFLLCLYEIDSPSSTRSARFAQIGLVCFGGIACLIKHQGILFPFAGLLFLLIRKWQKNASAEAFRAAAKWVIGAIAIPTITWLLILASCWEDFQIAEFGRNFMRIFHQTNEPSFNMPLQEYWLDLARKVLGPVTLFGIMMTVLVHWRLLLTDSRLLLLSLWSLLFIIFCSAIGLKSSRYFIAAMPAIVLLIASVAAPGMGERFLSKRKPVMKLIRFGFVAIVVAGCSYYICLNVLVLRLPRVTYYKDIGEAVKQISTKSDRLLLFHPQVALFADRDFVFSQFGKRFERIYERQHNIQVYVQDKSNMFHSSVSPADRIKFEQYVQTHFKRIPFPHISAPVYRRIRW